MTDMTFLDATLPGDSADAATRVSNWARGDDKAMLKAAADLTRDLNRARPAIYWADLIASALIGYAALFVSISSVAGLLPYAAGLVAIFALYRAGSFIHELTHIKPNAVPGFRLAWNLIIGVPLLVPSFLYEGVHNMHHGKTRYGTADDPEYLPLALMRPWTLPLFLAAAVAAPLVLLARFALVAPLSLVSPRLRALVVARYSGLQINPAFRRPSPSGTFAAEWRVMEVVTSLWALTLIGLAATGLIPLRSLLILLVVASGVMVLNQVRTLVAHLWENDGEPMSVTAQYLDSVNVPPPSTLPVLWAPVGLRYHALHHLLPGLPYHALGEAHRRLGARLDPQSSYHSASYRGLGRLVRRLVASSFRA